MALPYIFDSNFEQGTAAEWDSETDTASALSFPHYSTLATIPGAPAPYRGAYCAMWDIKTGITADAILIEGDIDIADGGTAYYRWYLYASLDFTATANDTFNIFELQEAGNTPEASVGMRVTAASNLLEIGIGDGTAPTSFVPFPRGKWICVELLATISTSDLGVLTLFLDGTQVATLTALDASGAVTRGVFGLQDTLATTTGRLFMDQFVNDDARIFPLNPRFPHDVLITKSSHIFVGSGTIENATLIMGNANNILTLYDTDVAYTSGYNEKLVLQASTADVIDPAGVPIKFQRGCYATLAGTTPRALVKVCHANGYWSDGRIKQHGAKRIAAPGNW